MRRRWRLPAWPNTKGQNRDRLGRRLLDTRTFKIINFYGKSGLIAFWWRVGNTVDIRNLLKSLPRPSV